MKSIVDLPASELRVLEEDIVDYLVSSVVESLYTEAVISTRRFSRRFWYRDIN